jgi:hypothetical protein
MQVHIKADRGIGVGIGLASARVTLGHLYCTAASFKCPNRKRIIL